MNTPALGEEKFHSRPPRHLKADRSLRRTAVEEESGCFLGPRDDPHCLVGEEHKDVLPRAALKENLRARYVQRWPDESW
jgi:hypothetical protein